MDNLIIEELSSAYSAITSANAEGHSLCHFINEGNHIIIDNTTNVEYLISDSEYDSLALLLGNNLLQIREPDSDENNSSEGSSEIIPVLPEGFLRDESTVRFSSAEWFDKVTTLDITLIGIGGIGSWTGLLLSRLKPNSMSTYDPDIVDSTNLSGQLYSNSDVGSSKVSSLFTIITSFGYYYRLSTYFRNFSSGDYTTKIVICGLDNMEARKLVFDKWKDSLPYTRRPQEFLFIDGRLSAEFFQIFCIRGDDAYNINKYETEFLFNSTEAEETICSYKQTSYMAAMIASFINNLLVNFAANSTMEGVRHMPFFTSYDAVTMQLKMED